MFVHVSDFEYDTLATFSEHLWIVEVRLQEGLTTIVVVVVVVVVGVVVVASCSLGRVRVMSRENGATIRNASLLLGTW
jgi:hypothetical protein